MISIYRKTLIIFFATIAVRLVFYYATGFMADDAYITFRYTENIVHGDGFVYNLGDRVLGTTTPLFTLLLSIFAVLTIKPAFSSLFISLVSSGLTAVILYRMALSLRFMRLAYLPVLAYILWPRSLPGDICGMETAFFTLLVMAAFYCQYHRLYFYAVAMATLATVTRPEGVLLLTVLLIFDGIYDRPNRWRFLTAPLMLLIPWLGFCYFYFGSVIPHSVTAKLALYSRFGTMSWWENLVYVMGWHNPAGLVLTLSAIAGAWWLRTRQNYGWPEICWLGAMIIFFTVSRTHLFFWYLVPMYPVLLLLATAAFPWLFDRLPQVKRRHTLFSAILAVVMVAALTAGSYRQAVYYREFQSCLQSLNKAVGLYLYANADRDHDTAAVEDIGYIGYYSRMRILDRDGLISPEAVSYNRQGRYLELILDNRPEWVGLADPSPLSEFRSDSLFMADYETVETFTAPNGRAYRIFKRREINN